MASELISDSRRILFAPYGQRWRKMRSFLHTYLSKTVYVSRKPPLAGSVISNSVLTSGICALRVDKLYSQVQLNEAKALALNLLNTREQ